MDWSDFLRGALSFFLIVTGIGLAYLFYRLANVFMRLGNSVRDMTGEVLPILHKAQSTVDGINLELARVDEIMVTAVNTTKGAERTVGTVSKAVTTPVRKASGLAAGAREAFSTFKARRKAEKAARREGLSTPVVVTTAPPPAPAPIVASSPAATEAGAVPAGTPGA